jgi:hypothetical protein
MSGGGGGGGQTVVQESKESQEARDLFRIQGDIAKKTFDWGQAHAVPLIEGLSEEAAVYSSPARQEKEADRAATDVSQQFAVTRGDMERSLTRRGVDPSSGMWRGLAGAERLNEAVSRAGAATAARRGIEGEGFQRKQIAAGLASGQSAPALAGLSSAASGMANLGANIDNRAFRAAELEQQRKSQRSSGFGELFGTLGSAALYKFSSKKLKHKKSPIADDMVLSKVKGLPVERWEYNDGVADEGEHIGPYAEDFNKSFGFPERPAIDMVDAAGVSLSAIKALAKKVESLERKVA